MKLQGDVRMPDRGMFRFSMGTPAAAGSTQGTATLLSEQVNAVTAADGTKGVRLPSAEFKKLVLVLNTSDTAALKVYPATSDAINALSADAAFELAPGVGAWFLATSNSQWYVAGGSDVGDILVGAGSDVVLDRGTLAAAGANAAAAAVVVAQVTVATGADGAKGVALPAAATSIGPYFIINDAAAPLLVYPVSGGNDNINGLAEDAAFTLAGGTLGIFVPTSATQWYVDTAKALGNPTPLTRSTVTDAATISAAQLRSRVLYQDASGGNVTMTTRTGTQIAGDLPEMRIGDAIQIWMASNHASNTSTIAGGTDVTLVGSGAVTQLGGSFLLIKTAATTFDLVRVG